MKPRLYHESRAKITPDAHPELTACPLLYFTNIFAFDEKQKKKKVFSPV